MTRSNWMFGRFGYTPTSVTQNSMQMLAAPDSGITVSRSAYVESLALENGGASIVRSSAGSRLFDMTWSTGDSATSSGLDIYQDYAQGLYGKAPVYVSDPMNWRTNLFPPNWGSPMLADPLGGNWLPIYGSASPTIAATAANTFNMPLNTATYTVTSAVNTIPAGGNQSIFLPIPTGYQLSVGATGSATGTGIVQVQPVNLAGTFAAVTNLGFLSATSSTRLNATFSGATYSGIIVYLARTSTAATTISLTSLMAQMFPIGYTGALPSLHVPGRGQSGMEFASDAVPETYVLVDAYGGTGRSLKGLSFQTQEVTPWRTTTS